MAVNIARVRWQMGQALLPDHFICQEESLSLEARTRFRMRGLPDYGAAELKINDSLLSEGVFSIQSIKMVMPSGLLVQIPGNSTVSPFNLNVPGAARLPVYFHLIHETAVGEKPASESDEGDGEIPRVFHPAALSSDQSYPNAFETLKLAEFEKSPDGIWRISPDYIPPLLQVGTSPFLAAELTELRELLDNFQYRLTQEIAASHLSGDSLTGAKQCLKSIYAIQRFLANLFHRVQPHPFHLYEALKNFYTEVCFYENMIPEHAAEPFDNDQSAPIFSRILVPLKEHLHAAQAPSPYLPFELRDNLWRAELPPKTREAREVYFLIQKRHVSQVISLREIKLASLSRVPLVHTLALQGILLNPIDRPPFQHSFGAEVDFYRIGEGEEWDHALRELNVGFYNLPQLEGLRFYLYWRII